MQKQESLGGVLDHESHQPPLYYIIGGFVYKGITWLGIRPTNIQHWVERINPRYIGRQQGPDTEQTFFVQQGTFFQPDPSFPYDLIFLRLYSVLMGALGVAAIYATCLLVWKNSVWPALLATSSIAFIPQLLFITASTNNDALAFAMGAIGILQFVKIMRTEQPRPFAYVLLGVLLGLGILTKLTLVSLIPLAVLHPLFVYKRNLRAILTAWVLMAAGFLLVSGWWFVRNWMLYEDLLGDHWKVNPEAFQWDLDPKSLFSDYFRLQNFWLRTGRSFVGMFGFMRIEMPGFFYPIYLTLFLMGVLGTGIALMRRGRVPEARLLLFMLMLVLMAVGQLIYLNLRVSQPQGRYLFHVAAAIAVVLVNGIIVLGNTLKEIGAGIVDSLRPPSHRSTQPLADRLERSSLVWLFVFLIVISNLYTLHHLHTIYKAP